MLRIRFIINQRTGSKRTTFAQETKRGRDFAMTVVEQVAYDYADDEFKKLQKQVKTRIEKDVSSAVRSTAQSFKNSVIGIAGRQKGISSQNLDINPTPIWAPRNKKYLKQKQKKLGHTQWFKSHSDGPLWEKMGKSSTWISAFGPLRVYLKKGVTVDGYDPAQKAFREANPASSRFNHQSSSRTTDAQFRKLTVGVGTIQVFALRRITPAMLPALASGDPSDWNAGDQRNGGLIDLLGKVDDRLAFRLGGRRGDVPYRPTLEPFLAFLLTRKIPREVQKRVKAGLFGDL